MPVTYFVKKLTDLDGNTVYEYGDNLASIAGSLAVLDRSAKSGGVGGRAHAKSMVDSYLLTLSCEVVASDMSDDQATLRSEVNDFTDAHAPGEDMRIYIDDDWFTIVRVIGEVRFEPWSGEVSMVAAVSLSSADDPPWHSEAVVTTPITEGDITVVGTMGDKARAEPEFYFSLNDVPEDGEITITNAAGGYFKFAPDSDGAWVVNVYTEELYVLGEDGVRVDKDYSILEMSDYQNLKLANGENVFTIAYSEDLPIDDEASFVIHRNRRY